MPTTDPLRAAVMCRYPLKLSNFPNTTVANLYFMAEDIDMTHASDGTAIITGCQAIEIIAVA